MRYASSDITSFTNAACPTGGHSRTVSNPKEVRKGAAPEYADERLVIDCPACEPLCVGKDSWSGDPLDIPLTQKEKQELEALEKQGLRQQALMAQALADLAHERVAGAA